MKLQKFLKEFGLQKLIDHYYITAKFGIEYPNLVQLTYSQTKTPKNEITNDCRGIIFDMNTWDVVAHPFTRFNDFEMNVKTNFNFKDFVSFEKLDGSMMSVYYYNNKWRVASKSTPDASGSIFLKENGTDIKISYQEYFWKIWKNKKYDIPLNQKYTYVFEFKFPSETSFLVKTDKVSITLIGIRNIETGIELPIESYSNLVNWDIVKPEKIDFPTLLEIAFNLNPIESEGFVIRDSNFNRLKVKSPLYDRIQLLRTYRGDEKMDNAIQSDNYNRLCSIIKYGYANPHLKDFLVYKEHVRQDFNKILKLYDKILNDIFKEVQITKNYEKSKLGLFCKNVSKFDKILFPLHDWIKENPNKELYEFFYNWENRKFTEIIKKFK